ncbi:MAG TPA: GntR family transcriptional regulator [Pirellulales bacterium]
MKKSRPAENRRPRTSRASEAVAAASAAGDASTCADDVYHEIMLRIVRGALTGGVELKSTLLAREFGVSRTPVLQALNRLAADGVIRLERNKRAIVLPGTENWLVEIHQLRELLEPNAAALAATNINEAELERLRGMQEEARPDSSPDWPAAAQRFDFGLHLAVAEACGNLVLGAAIRKCWSYKRLSYEAGADGHEVLAQAWTEHAAIVAALAAHDAEEASRAMLAHIRSAGSLRSARTIV